MNNENLNKLRGTFRHYKGGLYVIDCVAKHTETEELLVVYHDVKKNYWARPYDMFFGEAPQGKENVTNQENRFEKIN